jgi:GDP-4-dehydro-6-deoxy-D-mannose reductase
MKVLVTGANGFVGTLLCAHLSEAGHDVIATDVANMDITDLASTTAAVAEAQPELIIHLAALTDVAASWANPELCYRLNVTGVHNVLQASIALGREAYPRVLLVSSAEVYGPVDTSDMPITEQTPLRPSNPYATTKAAGEMLGIGAWHTHGLPVIISRSFNHIGPSQTAQFVVAALARRIAEAIKTGSNEIVVGNMSAQRDFLDVRDVIAAYVALAQQGQPGEAYNVCSGVPVSIQTIADQMIQASGHDIALRVDSELFRPNDVPIRFGDATKLHVQTGWKPQIPLNTTLSEIINNALQA